MDQTNLKLWIEVIKTDEIILTDGEYRFTLEVLNSGVDTNGLPELFQEATIQDRYELQVSPFEPELEDSDLEPAEE